MDVKKFEIEFNKAKGSNEFFPVNVILKNDIYIFCDEYAITKPLPCLFSRNNINCYEISFFRHGYTIARLPLTSIKAVKSIIRP